jgi:hypothetical protein
MHKERLFWRDVKTSTRDACASLYRRDRLGFFGRFGHHFVSLRNPHYFFDSRFALRDATPAILPQRFHAFGDGALFELAAIALPHDHLS